MPRRLDNWWTVWGATVIWVVTVVGSAFLVWHDLDKKLALVDMRLSNIEMRLPAPPRLETASFGETNPR